jgi:hypothetical protein
VAVVAQEARIRVDGRAHGVRDEVERIRDLLPVRHDARHVVVDGDVRIGVDHLADGRERPAVNVVVGERREVEWLGRGDDEEVSGTRVLAHPPRRCVREEQPVVPAPAHDLDRVGVLRINEVDAAVGVDPEDRGERVLARPVVDAYVLPGAEHRLVAAVEPDACFEGAGGFLSRRGAHEGRERDEHGELDV